MFKTVKKYFDKGTYSTDDVKVFVTAKYITEEQYKEITGLDYVAKTEEEKANS